MPRIRDLLGGEETGHFRDLRFSWQPNVVDVEFSNGRRQRIEYSLDGNHYAFVSRVAIGLKVKDVGIKIVAKEILARNRVVEVVSFGFGTDTAVEGRVEVRAETLNNKELQYYLAQLARECDRFEYWLSRTDLH